ncbi:MAG: hypothetical protein J0L82_05620 [Deltaproteobacteria bacterium]|nr:hypothetical protein [Deltaproteobacteria bacterium]
MKQIFNQFSDIALKALLAFGIFLFISSSGLSPNHAAASECDDQSFTVIPSDGKVPSGRIEVILKPGDDVWHMYECKQCRDGGEKRIVSLRPNANGSQECPNCGKPHSKDDRLEPRILPDHFTDAAGRIHLIYTEALARDGDATKKYARSGKHWTCEYCNSSAFQTMVSCPRCGAGNPSLLTPGRFRKYAEANPADPITGFPLGAASKVSSAAAPSAEMASQAVSQGQPITSAKGVGPIRSVDLQSSTRPNFLKTKTGMMLMSAAATGALGYVWWGTQSYTLPATVSSIDGNTAYITYIDTDGKEITIDFTPAQKEASIRGWRKGDRMTLHFRNLGGAKGGEAFDGTVVVPQGK